MGKDIVKKRGRPRKQKTKSHQYRLRMDDEDSKLLDYLSMQTGKNKSDIIREAIKMYGNLVKFRDN